MSAKGSGTTVKSVDQYIAGFPPKVRKILNDVRAAVRASAPDAAEKISYGVPAFWQGKILVAFADRLGGYTTSRGTVQFPFDRTVPLALVKKIVVSRVKACAPRRGPRNPPPP